MSERLERFLDRFTKPFAQNHELDLLVRREMTGIAGNEVKDEAFLKKAERRLETVDRTGWVRHWRLGLLILSVICAAGCLIAQVPRLIELQHELEILNIPRWVKYDQKFKLDYAKNLTRDQRLLLFGDLSKEEISERMRGLWELDRNNPAYFAEYAIMHYYNTGELVPGFLVEAARLDPENGWFPCFAASVTARGAVEKKSYGGYPAAPVWKVRNKAKLEETMRLFHEAMEKPKFESYDCGLKDQRLMLLPPRSDVVTSRVAMSLLREDGSSLAGWEKLNEAVAAQAGVLAGSSDSDGFQRLLKNWKSFVHRAEQEEGQGLWFVHKPYSLITTSALNFRDGARQFGLTAEEERISRLYDSAQSELSDVYYPKDSVSSLFIEQRGSMVARGMRDELIGNSHGAVAFDDALLAPGRFADHAVFGRIFMTFLWMVTLVIILAVYGYRFRGGMLADRISHRMMDLLLPADWAWIIVGGGVMPIVVFLILRYVLPFGGREYSIDEDNLRQLAFPYLILLSWVIVVPVLMARWRLQKGMVFFGFHFAAVQIGRVMLLLSLAAFWLTGIGPLSVWKIAESLLVLLSLWLVVGAVRALFGKKEKMISRQFVARAIFPAYLTSLLVLSILPSLFHAEEQHWVALDRLMQLNPGNHGMSDLEAEVVKVARKRMAKILAPLHE